MPLRISDITNMHAEMYGLHHTMHRMINEKVLDQLIEIHPSKEILLLMRGNVAALGWRMSEEFADKRFFSKWQDTDCACGRRGEKLLYSSADAGEIPF